MITLNNLGHRLNLIMVFLQESLLGLLKMMLRLWQRKH